jgi:hypothetical protein
MPKNVVYESLTEAQDYADRVNGQPVEVEGGYTVMNPLGYNGGGSADDLAKKTFGLMMGLVPKSKVDEKAGDERTEKKDPEGFKGNF